MLKKNEDGSVNHGPNLNHGILGLFNHSLNELIHIDHTSYEYELTSPFDNPIQIHGVNT